MSEGSNRKNVSQVDTDGGSYVGKNVNTGRDFIGRDVNITSHNNYYELRSENKQTQNVKRRFFIVACAVILTVICVISLVYTSVRPGLLGKPCSLESEILGRWELNSEENFFFQLGELKIFHTINFSKIEFLSNNTFVSSGGIIVTQEPSKRSIIFTDTSPNGINSGTYEVIDCFHIKIKFDGDDSFDVLAIFSVAGDSKQMYISFVDGTELTLKRPWWYLTTTCFTAWSIKDNWSA